MKKFYLVILFLFFSLLGFSFQITLSSNKTTIFKEDSTVTFSVHLNELDNGGVYRFEKYNGTMFTNFSEDYYTSTTQDFSFSVNISESGRYKLFYYLDVNALLTPYWSNEITITIIDNVIQSNQIICYNSIPNDLTGTVAPQYQWQYFMEAENEWWDIGSLKDFSFGSTRFTSNAKYRRKAVIPANGYETNYSNEITITVKEDWTAGTPTQDTYNVCYSTIPEQFICSYPHFADGCIETVSYEWWTTYDDGDVSPHPGKSNTKADVWSPAPGNNTSRYYQFPYELKKSCKFRRRDYDVYGSKFTSEIIVNVYEEISNPASSDKVICYNSSTKLTTSPATGGDNNFTYAWYYSTNNNNFIEISNSNSQSYNTNHLTKTTWFKRKAINTCGAVINIVPARIFVLDDIYPGNVQSNQNCFYNKIPSKLIGTESIGGDNSFYYQWQKSNDNSTWEDINNANSKDYQPDALTQTTWYRRKNDNSCKETYTNSVKITVYDEFNAGSITADQIISANSQPSLLNGVTCTGGDNNYHFTWLKSIDNSTWTEISNTDNLSYQPDILTQTTWYKRKDESGGIYLFTNSVCITVYGTSSAATIGYSQSVCFDTQPDELIELNPAVSCDGNSLSHSWELSEDGHKYLGIFVFDANYQPDALTKTAWYRRYDYNKNCTAVFSNVVKITVLEPVTAGTILGEQTICNGKTPTKLTGTEPTGGDNNFSYQWQCSTDNTASWTDILTATDLNYQPGALAQSTWYRRKDINNCKTVITNVVKISVLEPVTAGIIGSEQIICNEEIPTKLTGTEPIGGSDNFTYQWQSSIDNTASWTDILTATDLNYQPDTLTQTTWYRRKDIENCKTVYTNAIKVTVLEPVTAGTIESEQTICNGETPTKLIGIEPTGGDNNFIYQWQCSIDSTASWTDILTATNLNYQPGALAQSTWYRRKDINNCKTVITNVVKITVLKPVTAGIIGNEQIICNGETPTKLTGTEPIGGDDNFIYQWQCSTDNTASWTDILTATDLNYQPEALTQTTWYRRKDINNCKTVYTNVIKITVLEPVTAGTIGSEQIICNKKTPTVLTGTEPTGGDNQFTYRWQKSNDNSIWQDINVSNSKDYQPDTLISDTWFRRKDINNCKTAYTNVIKITVLEPVTAGTIESKQIICNGEMPTELTGTVPTGGDNNYTYQWQYLTDSTASWTDILTATDLNYQPEALTQTTWYRRKDINNCKTVYTNAIKVTVLEPVTAGTIKDEQTICNGKTPIKLTGIEPTGGDNNYTYQWQISKNNTASWTDILTATNLNYQPDALTQTTWYRRKDIDNCKMVYTNVIKITVLEPVTAGIIGNEQIICNGEMPTKLIGTVSTGGDSIFTYQWQSSTDNMVSWTDILTATNLNYQPDVLTQSTWYRRKDINNCKTVITNVIKITVLGPVTAGTIESKQTICNGEMPFELIGIEPTGGDNNFTYQWQYSTDSMASWTDILTATNLNYQPDALTQITWYRRKDIDNCKTVYTNAIKVTVLEPVTAGTIKGEQTICNGEISTKLTGTEPTGGDNNYTYQWQMSKDNTTSWTDILTATNLNYQPEALTSNTWFRRKDINDCNSVYTNTIKIIVNDSVPMPKISSKKIYCKNEDVKLSVINPGEGIYNWYQEDMTFLTTGINYEIPKINSNKIFYVNRINVNGCYSKYQKINLKIDSIFVDFYSDVNIIKEGSVVQFFNESINVDSCVWNFFDGDKSYKDDPYHFYNKKGNYNVKLTVYSENNCVDSLRKENYILVENLNVGIEQTKNLKIEVYPNPTKKFITIKAPFNFQYELLNSYGKVILHSFKNSTFAVVNLENFNCHFFILRLIEHKKIYNFKIIKQ